MRGSEEESISGEEGEGTCLEGGKEELECCETEQKGGWMERKKQDNAL